MKPEMRINGRFCDCSWTEILKSAWAGHSTEQRTAFPADNGKIRVIRPLKFFLGLPEFLELHR